MEHLRVDAPKVRGHLRLVRRDHVIADDAGPAPTPAPAGNERQLARDGPQRELLANGLEFLASNYPVLPVNRVFYTSVVEGRSYDASASCFPQRSPPVVVSEDLQRLVGGRTRL